MTFPVPIGIFNIIVNVFEVKLLIEVLIIVSSKTLTFVVNCWSSEFFIIINFRTIVSFLYISLHMFNEYLRSGITFYLKIR